MENYIFKFTNVYLPIAFLYENSSLFRNIVRHFHHFPSTLISPAVRLIYFFPHKNPATFTAAGF